MGQMKTTSLNRTILLLIGFWTALIISCNAQNANGTKSDDNESTIEKAYELMYKLVHKAEPTFKPYEPKPIDPQALADMGFEQVYESIPVKIRVRDGKDLFAQKFTSQSNVTILLLHGMLSSSYTMNKMAGLLREASNAEVIAIDLRGHGQSAGRPGDVEYIDQFADDLSDIINILKKEKPKSKIILAGHSMGGGIAIRYAQKKESLHVDGYLLFAPLLGHTSPTLPTTTTVEAQSEPFMKIHFDRIIGLKMFNGLGVHTYDSLNVLFFNLPPGMPLTQYSYRSNVSMAPDDYKDGLKAVKKPMLVIVGDKDEAFVASEFKPAITQYSTGEIVLIEGSTHNGVRHSSTAMDAVKSWVKKCSFN